MKHFICLAAAAALYVCVPSAAETPQSRDGRDSLLVMFWNVENFFDWEDGGSGESDTEFSENGARHWTRRRFYAKCGMIAKSIFHICSSEGRMPDIIGLAEIENERVLKALLSSTLLRKCSYRPVTFPSMDPRGIDVAILYNERTLSPEYIRPAGVFLPGGERLLSRDILVGTFCQRGGGGRRIAVTVNHHPSKYGGAASEPKRAAAVRGLLSISDSLSTAGWPLQLHVGDFNDVPSSPLYDTLKVKMCSLAAPLEEKGEGSIRFDGRWEMIDQAFTVPAGGRPVPTMKVCAIPFLTTRDSAHSGTRPLRTYSGPRYLGGVSDHYPIIVWIEW